MKLAAVLAAGSSYRLGQPKQLLRWGNESLLAHAITTLRAAGAEKIGVVVGAHREAILESFSESDHTSLDWIANDRFREGQATSLHAAIAAYAPLMHHDDALIIALCDQPTIPASHYRALLDVVCVGMQPCSATQYPSGPGVPACFNVEALGRLEAAGDGGAKQWLRSQPPGCVRVIPCDHALRDIDTLQQWQALH